LQLAFHDLRGQNGGQQDNQREKTNRTHIRYIPDERVLFTNSAEVYDPNKYRIAQQMQFET